MQPTQLDALLKFLTDTLAQGKDFTLEQAPLFVRELLLWRFWSDAIWAASITAAMLVVAVAVGWWDDDASRWFTRTWCALIIVIAVSMNAYDMVKVTVAPRVVLVEEVRRLIGGQR